MLRMTNLKSHDGNGYSTGDGSGFDVAEKMSNPDQM
jgi:hypothetical protein